MKIGTPKEIFDGEDRVALTPDSALQLQKLGFDCLIESGAGKAAGYSDKIYKEAGVKVVKTAAALWKEADVVTKVRQPSTAELKRLSAGQTLISFFNPAVNEQGLDLAKSKKSKRHSNGNGSKDQSGTKDGCSFIHGKYSWLSSSYRGQQ